MAGNNLISANPAPAANALMGGATMPGNTAGSEQQNTGAPGQGAAPNINVVTEALNKQAHIDALMRQTMMIEGGPTRKDVVKLATEIIREGLMPATKMAQYLSDLPTEPMEVKKWLGTHAQAIEQGLGQAAQMLYGSTRQQQPQMPPAATAAPGMP